MAPRGLWGAEWGFHSDYSGDTQTLEPGAGLLRTRTAKQAPAAWATRGWEGPSRLLGRVLQQVQGDISLVSSPPRTWGIWLGLGIWV